MAVGAARGSSAALMIILDPTLSIVVSGHLMLPLAGACQFLLNPLSLLPLQQLRRGGPPLAARGRVIQFLMVLRRCQGGPFGIRSLLILLLQSGGNIAGIR